MSARVISFPRDLARATRAQTPDPRIQRLADLIEEAMANSPGMGQRDTVRMLANRIAAATKAAPRAKE